MNKVIWTGFGFEELEAEFEAAKHVIEFMSKDNIKPYVTKIVINGMKNMFNADDPEERIEILKKMYANFFLLTKYFTITHISWKTGFISALTPNYNQVLIYASIKNDDVRDGLFTFIPIKKNIGISVAGLDRDEIIDLENIWLNVSKE